MHACVESPHLNLALLLVCFPIVINKKNLLHGFNPYITFSMCANKPAHLDLSFLGAEKRHV